MQVLARLFQVLRASSLLVSLDLSHLDRTADMMNVSKSFYLRLSLACMIGPLGVASNSSVHAVVLYVGGHTLTRREVSIAAFTLEKGSLPLLIRTYVYLGAIHSDLTPGGL